MRRATAVSLLALGALASCEGERSAPPTEKSPAAAKSAGRERAAKAVAGPDRAAPVDPAPWWSGAVVYQVFVRSFQDSAKDGIGDFKGLTQRLDYLNDGDPKTDGDLGVDAIWLMPVFQSPSYHGYDVVDYETIEEDYGTGEDFQKFLDEAHKRGMRVILDLMLNHSSVEHPWFVESATSPKSAKRDWYVWSDKKLDWGQPWNEAEPTWHERNGAYYYGVFWGGMPDLNFRNQAVRAEAIRVAKLWLQRGVDGFRLDAIRHLIEDGPGPGQSKSADTHAYLKEFSAAVHQVKPDAVLVGEVWSTTYDIAEYYGESGRDELQLLFDFPLAEAMIGAVNGGQAGDLASVLGLIQNAYPKGAVDAPFLANHDQIRTATQLGGDAAKLRLAAALLLTMPGTPFLYYGEEIGLENGPGKEDEWKRTPMPWDRSPRHGFSAGKAWYKFAPGAGRTNVAAQTKDSKSLLARYRVLIAARKASAALRRGGIEVVSAPGAQSSALAFVRASEGERVLVVHNVSTEAIDTGALTVKGTAGEPLFADPGAKLVADGDGLRAELPPRASGVWPLR
jgi:alpha-amylase